MTEVAVHPAFALVLGGIVAGVLRGRFASMVMVIAPILGFWTVTEPHADRELVYLLRWESEAASEAGWAAFRDDPEWIETRSVTEENGPLVEEVEEPISHLWPDTIRRIPEEIWFSGEYE